MPPVRTPALVLHAFAYGETSRILRLLTPDLGMRSVIAKGAAGPKSRFGGILEPFTEGEAQFYLRANRDLHTLTSFTLVRSRQAIGRDLASFTGASLVAELMIRFGTEEANPELYEAVVSGFDRLAARDEEPVGAALAILWNLVALFGFRPEMKACTRCGRTIDETESTRFDPDAGGIACFACRTVGRTLPPDVRTEVDRMARSAAASVPPRTRAVHRTLLQTFLSTHVLHGQPLRSLPLFLEQLR